MCACMPVCYTQWIVSYAMVVGMRSTPHPNLLKTPLQRIQEKLHTSVRRCGAGGSVGKGVHMHHGQKLGTCPERFGAAVPWNPHFCGEGNEIDSAAGVAMVKHLRACVWECILLHCMRKLIMPCYEFSITCTCPRFPNSSPISAITSNSATTRLEKSTNPQTN